MSGPALSVYPRLRSDLRIGRRTRRRSGQDGIVIQDALLQGTQHPGFSVSATANPLLERLDGLTAVQDLPARLSAECGIRVSEAELTTFLHALERHHLLDDSNSRERLAALETYCAQLTVRPSCNENGWLYPQDACELVDLLDRQQVSSLPDPGRKVRVMVLPHASLSVAARSMVRGAVRTLATAPATTYVIVGPNQVSSGPPQCELSDKPFETPLGVVRVNLALAGELSRRVGERLVIRHSTHFRDHAIEAILPCLQWLHGTRGPKNCAFTIVPLLLTGVRHRPSGDEPIGHVEVWESVAEAIMRTVLLEPDKDTVVIASGDLTHWGPLYDFKPFADAADARFLEWDRPFLDAISRCDSRALLDAWRAGNSCLGRPAYVVARALEMMSERLPGFAPSLLLMDYRVACSDGHGVSLASFTAEW